MTTKKKTTADFIADARAVHGNKYDYSKAVYTGALKKLIITCPEHGDFEQTANSHLQGSDCRQCGNRKIAAKHQCSPADFIRKAIAKHGERYDYSATRYIGALDPITIRCPEHGEFTQQANSHLQGVGCPSCAGVTRYTTATFITAAKAVHGDRYTYPDAVYQGSGEPIAIMCAAHGTFHQVPSKHLGGSHCPQCATESSAALNRITQAEFIKQATATHNGRYDYSLTDYVHAHQKITIICPDHGAFEQKADSHKKGAGCPVCAPRGIWQHETACVYVLRYGDDLVKIGIASNVAERLKQLRRASVLPITVHAIAAVGTGQQAWEIEQAAHRLLDAYHAGLKGFDGSTELFTCSASVALAAVADSIGG